MNFTDLKPLFDFSQWEVGIQAFFCDAVQGGGLFAQPPDNEDATAADWNPADGKTAFFTGRQSNVFQRQRPRVDLAPIDYTVFNNAMIIDVNRRKQHRAWVVPLKFFAITPADYARHVDFIATCRAIISGMQPANDAIATTGLNPFLTTHELGEIHDLGGPTLGGKWTGDQGYFITPLNYQATFAVKASAWPT